MPPSPAAVVTRASTGVGRATAALLAERGYDVGLPARGAAGAAHDVRAAGGTPMEPPTDVADFEQVDPAASRTEEEPGPIELSINNAMATVFAPSREVAPADFERAVAVTLLGRVRGTQAASARMRPRDGGTIVDVGSALAFIGIPLQGAHCSSKFACRGFFEATRAELAHEGSRVRMSMRHLPAVNTPQFGWCKTTLDRHSQPVPPIHQPEIPARRSVETALDARPQQAVGSWNRMLVLAGRLFPNLGNQYAALGARGTEPTGRPIPADRPANLYHPVDEDRDRGAHGVLDDRAGGALSPSLVASLPATARTFVSALARTVSEKRSVLAADTPTPE